MNDVFKISVKNRELEEFADYYFFRRLSSWLVPVLAFLKLSPNQVTFLALVAGFVAAFFYFKGFFLLGSLSLLAAVVLDCADGMLARYTRSYHPLGKIIDGTCDFFWTVAIWSCLYFGRHLEPYAPTYLFYLMFSAGALIPLHCWTFESVKSRYLSLLDPQPAGMLMSAEESWKKYHQSFHQKKYFEAFFYLLLAGYQKIFAPVGGVTLTESERRKAFEVLKAPLRLWTFCGEGTHHFIMIFFGCLSFFNPKWMLLTFWVILIPINIIWLWAILWWRGQMRFIFSRASSKSS